MYGKSLGASIALFFASSAGAATLTFDTLAPNQATEGPSLSGAPTVAGLSAFFLGVASEHGQTVDARVTATLAPGTALGDGSTYAGIPNALIYDYAGNGAAPQDDFAFFYTASGIDAVENGLTLEFEFFDGTGAQSGTFENLVTLKELNIAVYDVDGEATQSEFVRAFRDDGLVRFGLGTTPQALTATTEDDGVIRFDGPGQNFAETDATGAALLTYANTASFRLNFGSVQSGGSPRNPVFSAIDGDLSMFTPGEFNMATVSIPAGGSLLLSALTAMGYTRWRMDRHKRRRARRRKEHQAGLAARQAAA